MGLYSYFIRSFVMPTIICKLLCQDYSPATVSLLHSCNIASSAFVTKILYCWLEMDTKDYLNDHDAEDFLDIVIITLLL